MTQAEEINSPHNTDASSKPLEACRRIVSLLAKSRNNNSGRPTIAQLNEIFKLANFVVAKGGAK